MSHATCLVIMDKEDYLDDLLAPFNENTDDPDYMSFYEYEDQIREGYKDYVDNLKEGEEQFSFEEYASEEGYKYDEEEQAWGYYSCSDPQWDWWVVGGRWENKLKLKDDIKYPDDIIIGEYKEFTGCETHCSAARKCDIDFEGMIQEDIESSKKHYRNIIEKINNGESDEKSLFFYGIHKKENGEIETEEEYINRYCDGGFSYSMLKDGDWISHGSLGWFGTSSNETDNWAEIQKRILDDTDDEQIIVLVDYHI